LPQRSGSRLLNGLATALAIAAVIELSVAVSTWLAGGFRFAIGPLQVVSTDPWKPLLFGVLAGAVALWITESRRRPLSTRRPALWYTVALTPVVVVAAVTCWPLAGPGFAYGHDAAAHVTYTYLFDRALEQGQFPVRWIEWVEAGRGQPLFSFYQVGLYYFVQCVHLLVPSLELSLKTATIALWCLGPLFVFLLLKRHGAVPAAAASVAFMSAPYILLDGYVRAAIPELAALSIALGVLWTVDAFARSGRRPMLLATAWLTAALLITHLPTALIMGPVVASSVVWVMFEKGINLPRLGWLAVTVGLGVAMASFYVWPALQEMPFVNMRNLTVGTLDYQQHFLSPTQWFDYRWGYGPATDKGGQRMSFGVGPAQWLSAAVTIVVIVRGAGRGRRRDGIFWLAVFGLGLFMTTRASSPIWDRFPPLAFVQFPWRILMVPAVAAAGLTAIAVAAVSTRSRQLILLVVLATSQLYATRDARRFVRQVQRLEMNIDHDGWWTTAGEMAQPFREASYDPVGAGGSKEPVSGRWSALGQSEAIVPRQIADHAVALATSSADPMTLVINSPYFPGWRTSIDGNDTAMATDEHGFMVVPVPAGRHEVATVFGDTPVRRYANAVSLVATGIWLLLIGVAGARWWFTGRTLPRSPVGGE
jgi:hypothetical protein